MGCHFEHLLDSLTHVCREEQKQQIILSLPYTTNIYIVLGIRQNRMAFRSVLTELFQHLVALVQNEVIDVLGVEGPSCPW